MTAQNRTTMKSLLENGDTIDETTTIDLVDSFLALEDPNAQTVSGAVTFNSLTNHNAGISTTTVSASQVIAGTLRGAYRYTVDINVTAVSTAQTSAFSVSAFYTRVVSVVAGSDDAVRISAASPRAFVVFNDTNANLKVYPPSGATIDNLASNAAYVVSASVVREFDFLSTTLIRSR